MNSKFNKQAYEDMVNRVRELQGHASIYEANTSKASKLWTNMKAMFIAAFVLAIAVFILMGSLILIPIVLVVAIGYAVFLGVRASIK